MGDAGDTGHAGRNAVVFNVAVGFGRGGPAADEIEAKGIDSGQQPAAGAAGMAVGAATQLGATLPSVCTI